MSYNAGFHWLVAYPHMSWRCFLKKEAEKGEKDFEKKNVFKKAGKEKELGIEYVDTRSAREARTCSLGKQSLYVVKLADGDFTNYRS